MERKAHEDCPASRLHAPRLDSAANVLCLGRALQKLKARLRISLGGLSDSVLTHSVGGDKSPGGFGGLCGPAAIPREVGGSPGRILEVGRVRVTVDAA